MGDFFLNLAANKTARSVVKTLGLPLPMPQTLARDTTPCDAAPLRGRVAVIGGGADTPLGGTLRAALADAGATLADSDDARPDLLVCDATALEQPDDLRALYDFFHPWVRALNPCGRVLVATRPADAAASPAQAAARQAVDGFTRSIGREVGRRGATSATLIVAEGAESSVDPALRFLLSPRAAYVSGQPLRLDGPAPEGWPREQALRDKVALVTGAARGIGEATARVLAREGARVVVMDRPAELDAARAVAAAVGGTAVGCDVTDPAAAESVLAHLREAHGGALDIVVHNAGVTRDKTLANMSPEAWDLVIAINLGGLIRLNEALLPALRDGGRIVALSSIGGIGGNFGQTNYAATKAGVIGYVRALGPALAGRGVTVNAIAPGFIETQMTAAIPATTREVARRMCSLSQGGQPQDIAEAVAFLASPGAGGVNGQFLRVCGGNYVGA